MAKNLSIKKGLLGLHISALQAIVLQIIIDAFLKHQTDPVTIDFIADSTGQPSDLVEAALASLTEQGYLHGVGEWGEISSFKVEPSFTFKLSEQQRRFIPTENGGRVEAPKPRTKDDMARIGTDTRLIDDTLYNAEVKGDPEGGFTLDATRQADDHAVIRGFSFKTPAEAWDYFYRMDKPLADMIQANFTDKRSEKEKRIQEIRTKLAEYESLTNDAGQDLSEAQLADITVLKNELALLENNNAKELPAPTQKQQRPKRPPKAARGR